MPAVGATIRRCHPWAPPARALCEGREQPLERVEPCAPDLAELTRRDGLVDRAVGRVRQVRAAARAVLGDAARSVNAPRMFAGSTWPEPERAHARGVDDPAGAAVAVLDAERDRRRRRVPPAAGDLVDPADRPVGAGHERVHERRLADAGVPDEDGAMPDRGHE